MITIDGSFGEGGGQILRTSISLSALTGQDVKITNIRANRDKPGLRPQHLTGILAVAEICKAELTGAEVGSSEITFRPHAVRSGSYEFDISRIRASAGSVNLVLQTIIWPLAFAEKKSRITIKGGTHVPHAPTSNYISDIFLPTIADMGFICDYRMIKAGYYPIGGGEVKIEMRPVESLKPLSATERPASIHIELTSAVSNLPISIAQRQLDAGVEYLNSFGHFLTGEVDEYPSPGKGTVFFANISANGIRAGFQALGELKKRAEKVAEEACVEAAQYINSNAALDKHLADQLIIPIALAEGRSAFTTSEITNHLITNISVVERFLDARFRIIGEIGKPGRVEKAKS